MNKKVLVLVVAATVGLGSTSLVLAKPDVEKMKGADHRQEMKDAKEKHHGKKDKMRDKVKNDNDDEFDLDDDGGKLKRKGMHHDKKDKMRDKVENYDDDEFDLDDDGGKFKRKGKSDMPAGLAKQREKKMGQEQKELGKGSDQGQASREEHSRKWWKFWGE